MSNREKTTAFDADGVLVNSQDLVIEAVNERFETNFVLEDWVTFSYLYEEVQKLTSDDPEENPETVASWMFSTLIMSTSQPYPDALETSQKLAESGYKQLVFTSRPPHQEEATKNWFEEHYPWIDRDDIYLQSADSNLNGDQFKQRQIEKLRPLTFVDDNAETVQFLLEQGLLRPNLLVALLLRDRPWNENYNDLDKIRAKQMGRLLGELGI